MFNELLNFRNTQSIRNEKIKNKTMSICNLFYWIVWIVFFFSDIFFFFTFVIVAQKMYKKFLLTNEKLVYNIKPFKFFIESPRSLIHHHHRYEWDVFNDSWNHYPCFTYLESKVLSTIIIDRSVNARVSFKANNRSSPKIRQTRMNFFRVW